MTLALGKLQSGKLIMFSFVLLLLCNLSKVRELLKLQNREKGKRKKKKMLYMCEWERARGAFSASCMLFIHSLEFESTEGKRNRK